jgi:hypothetical protein
MASNESFFYKYLGLKRDQTVRSDFLTNGLFRFTQPNELNDPFEVNPRILMEAYSDEDWELARQRGLKDGFPPDQFDQWKHLLVATTPRGRITPEEFPGIPYPEGIHSMQELDEHNAKKELATLLKHINESFGIFCLTTSKENLVMWSLYAESHKGLVVGFEGSHPFFSDSHDFNRVEYSEQRISLSSNNGYLRLVGKHFSPKSHYKDLPTRLFLRKHPDWRNEKEWRMIRRLDEATLRAPGDSLVYLFEIPCEAIRLLILGAQISNENKEEIHRLASSSDKWSHVQILQAHLSSSSFGLEFRESHLAR